MLLVQMNIVISMYDSIANAMLAVGMTAPVKFNT